VCDVNEKLKKNFKKEENAAKLFLLYNNKNN